MIQGSATRDAPTCKKGDGRDNGYPPFSFTTLSEDTLLQMMPSTKRTLLMLQNFYNNYYYNNHAGVLFTMRVNDGINNEFLRNCSTIPSEPNFCSGAVTIHNNKQSQLQNQNTQ
jgi:hypothetical protein